MFTTKFMFTNIKGLCNVSFRLHIVSFFFKQHPYIVYISGSIRMLFSVNFFINFKSSSIEKYGENAYRITGDLTIRDVTKEVVLDAEYLGSWETPFWVDGEDKGPKTRIGFSATARINRFDFGVNWQSEMGDNGVVVGEDVYITIDVEALKD